MCKRQTNQIRRELKRAVFVLLVLGSSTGTIWAIANGYSGRIQGLAEEIVLNAEELRDATSGPVYNRTEVDEILGEMKELISEYEAVMVFAESPYPGEMMLGSTPGGDSTWLEALCSTRYDGPLKEIRIRRTGQRASYLRINDIEITYSTPEGWGRETFNKDGRVKLYSDGVFKLALPRPMRIKRIRIKINHESTGLEITGIPYYPDGAPRFPRRMRHPAVENRGPSEVLLGTTPGGDNTWLETLCSNPSPRPIREIQLKRTGSKTSYIRINDIEVTYLTPAGTRKEVFNKNGRVKLYQDGIFKLSLARPMMVVNIRILVNHKSTGLEVYGVY
ncbi:MAG: hypothetical protein H8D56_05725 [Planctomycetes bacterium]|nr:hypothetical protein [Planctomycetota bacterium]MBL7145444.1 hypothetical protein [Phycisphaerae bacterium]